MKKLFYIFFALTCEIAAAQSGQSAFKPVFISKVPKPLAPPSLVISDISFNDKMGNNNQILDVNEDAEISFKVKNAGKGDAYYTKITARAEGKNEGIIFNGEEVIGKIEPGSERVLTVPLKSNMSLESGKVNFTIRLKEGNGFDSEPFKLSFQTQKFRNPLLVVPDYLFSNNESEGKMRAGQSISLKLLIQNQGQGTAKNVVVKFSTPENVFPAGQSGFILDDLKPNESRNLVYEFFANKQYSNAEIPVQVNISESLNQFGLKKTISVALDQSLPKTSEIVVNASTEPTVEIVEASLLPDVDKNIPVNESKNEYRFALIVGNENYSGFQQELNTEANVDFARNDARIFKQYCLSTLGIPEDNITFITDATAARMKQGVDKMNKLIKNSQGKAEVLFYYAGHGMPDEKNKDSYLVPVDVNGNDLQNALQLRSVYNSLTEFPCKRITVFLDACFSGGGRNEGLVAGRSVKVTPRSEMLKGKMLVFAASSGEQVSLPYKNKQHGMFTYFLLKALQETKGDLTYRDLQNYLEGKVGLESVKINNREQNPQLNMSEEMKKEFENLRLK